MRYRYPFITIVLIFLYFSVNAQEGVSFKRINQHINALEEKVTAIERSTYLITKQLNDIESYHPHLKDTLLIKHSINEALLEGTLDTLRQLNASFSLLEKTTIDQFVDVNNKTDQLRQYIIFFSIALGGLFIGLFLWIRKIIKKHIMMLHDHNLANFGDLQDQLHTNTSEIRNTVKKQEKNTKKYIRKRT